MLRNPPAADWLNWRRTLDGHGYSPLAAIDRGNVGRLKLAWTLTMHEGSNQGTPLIHDGVMFLTHPGNVIQALDAASGDLLWEYSYAYPTESRTLGGPTRNIAIYGDKLYLATYDAAIVAIDARTGREVWRTTKADFAKGYTHTAGPVIADGVVVSGINGCERFKKEGCFITGHDPATGRELWRTSTIALPPDPNDASWGKIPPELRGGADTWIAGSYDPELKLYYVGTSQAKPWVAASRGMSPRDAGALHRIDARARPAHRQDPLVLPAHSRRVARHGERLRACARRPRRSAAALHDRQGRHSLEARSPYREVHRFCRDDVPEHLQAARSPHGTARIPRRHRQREDRRHRLRLSEHLWRTQLAGDRLTTRATLR
jgi:hypothetical protein